MCQGSIEQPKCTLRNQAAAKSLAGRSALQGLPQSKAASHLTQEYAVVGTQLPRPLLQVLPDSAG